MKATVEAVVDTTEADDVIAPASISFLKQTLLQPLVIKSGIDSVVAVAVAVKLLVIFLFVVVDVVVTTDVVKESLLLIISVSLL